MKKLVALLVVLGSMGGLFFLANSCKRPLPWHQQYCTDIEQAILDSTVRLVFHGWIEVEDGQTVERIYGTISHATVINGRYLLTHNHFGIPLSQIQLFNQYASGGFTGVSVYRIDGTAVLDHAPLDVFVVQAEKGETVLLDFGTVYGQGFFANAGIGSATMAEADTVHLYPGVEVALIDWDGLSQTRVVWARIKISYQENGVPVMQVNHFIELGASGGGVFLDGKHIGNNWGRIVGTNGITHHIRRQLSLVALN